MSHNGMIKATWTEVLGLTWKCMEAGEMRAVLVKVRKTDATSI
jgi:hypothetical protein